MGKRGFFSKFKSRVLNILFWSIISAAFIGPGTVTTATKAGADFQFQLLWALLFATFACLILHLCVGAGVEAVHAERNHSRSRYQVAYSVSFLRLNPSVGNDAYE